MGASVSAGVGEMETEQSKDHEREFVRVNILELVKLLVMTKSRVCHVRTQPCK